MPERAYRAKVGTRIGSDLTVLGIVDDHGKEPVYLVWHHKRWCPMACKVFKSKKEARREAEILQALAHPNIVRSLGMDGPTRLLMEYLEGPSLHDLLKAGRSVDWASMTRFDYRFISAPPSGMFMRAAWSTST